MPKLTPRQIAEPGQCGSCQHFRAREIGDGFGLCTFRMPPWVAEKQINAERDSECNERTVHDTNSCSLYEIRNVAGDPVEFIQERAWQAGTPSR